MGNVRKFRLLVVTPTHISSGVKYSPIEYLIDREAEVLKRYSVGDIVRVAKEKSLLNSIATLFKREDIHRYSLEKLIATNVSFRNLISSTKPHYTASVKGEHIPELSHIEELLKLGNQIFIPGSELKGSLRRALFTYILNKDEDLLNQLIENLKDIVISAKKEKKQVRKEIEEISQKIENRIFRAGSRNAQDDIFKLVQISDSSFKPATQETLKVKEIATYYISGEKKEKASIYSETIVPKVDFEFKIKTFLTEPLKKKFSNPRYHEIIKSAILSGNPFELLALWKEGERISIEIDWENLIPPKNKPPEAAKFLKWLSTKGKERNVIRLGKHEGYLFTTVMAIVKQKDEELFSEIFRLSVPKFSNLPNKTRKLTEREKFPLGFCIVEEKNRNAN